MGKSDLGGISTVFNAVTSSYRSRVAVAVVSKRKSGGVNVSTVINVNDFSCEEPCAGFVGEVSVDHELVVVTVYRIVATAKESTEAVTKVG